MTSSIFLSIVVTVVLGCCYCQIFVPPTRITPLDASTSSRPSSSLISFRNGTQNFTCNRIGSVCDSDCRTLLTCLERNNHPRFQKPCSEISPDTPYCVGNKCTKIPDNNNPNCSVSAVPNSFICTDEGFFPDPDRCDRFYSCNATNGVAIEYSCPPGSIYDSHVSSCIMISTGNGGNNAAIAIPANQRCSPVVCPRSNQPISIAYRPNPLYYILCYENIKMVFRCRDEQNHIFDNRIEECTFNCREPGIFVDRLDCNYFYNCHRVGNRFVVTSNKCPDNHYFNTTRCVRETTKCTPEIV